MARRSASPGRADRGGQFLQYGVVFALVAALAAAVISTAPSMGSTIAADI